MKLFSNYGHLYLSSINPPKISLDLDHTHQDFVNELNRAYAIEFRDSLIANQLFELGVKSLIDIGCDFGSLLAACNIKGIKAVGIETDEESIKKAEHVGLSVYNTSIQALVNSGFNFPLRQEISKLEKPIAISCLNILHGQWLSNQIRSDFLKFIASESDYLIITSIGPTLKSDLGIIDPSKYWGLLPFKVPVSKRLAFKLQYGSSNHFRILKRIFLNLPIDDYFSNISNSQYQDKFNIYARLVVVFDLTTKSKSYA